MMRLSRLSSSCTAWMDSAVGTLACSLTLRYLPFRRGFTQHCSAGMS